LPDGVNVRHPPSCSTDRSVTGLPGLRSADSNYPLASPVPLPCEAPQARRSVRLVITTLHLCAFLRFSAVLIGDCPNS
jgi:hypothetical protein